MRTSPSAAFSPSSEKVTVQEKLARTPGRSAWLTCSTPNGSVAGDVLAMAFPWFMVVSQLVTGTEYVMSRANDGSDWFHATMALRRLSNVETTSWPISPRS